MAKKLTCKMVEAQLREMCGNISAVAQRCGVSRQSVYSFLNAHPTLEAVLQETRETMVDHVESVLGKCALQGESWAVKYYLSNQGRHRGYGSETESDPSRKLVVDWASLYETPIQDDPVQRRLEEAHGTLINTTATTTTADEAAERQQLEARIAELRARTNGETP